ncbi:hypothetical protein [Gorillibacterium timonense]|uniref:hypothetical protein n=1 Tax=Gorillibacterium timonense TaxID=1689269 RepID=UPI00071D5266|nr:hypothetical protein [Gorillibacterium timonense]
MTEREAQREEDKEADLLARIARLERDLARLVRLSGRPITVQQLHVDELHVDTLHLDQPSYRLDSLTVRELSGSLNLGNNFASLRSLGRREAEKETPGDGVQAERKEEAAPNSADGSTEPAHAPKLRRTGSGIRYTLE